MGDLTPPLPLGAYVLYGRPQSICLLSKMSKKTRPNLITGSTLRKLKIRLGKRDKITFKVPLYCVYPFTATTFDPAKTGISLEI